MDKIRYFLMVVGISLFVSACKSIKPEVGQVVFASPDDAVAALCDAAQKDDAKRLMEIFGPEGKDIVYSGDEKYDSESRSFFAKKAKEKTTLDKEEDLYYLSIGNDDWPFPVPVAIYDGKAFFYTPEGTEEVINRRIGRNELNAIRICNTIVDTQEKFARMKMIKGAAREYASRFFGDQGEKDGLYWDTDKNLDEKNQIGALVVLASRDVPADKRKPYYGYFYKILTAQGPDAPGGKKSYLVDGKMKNGFALVAYPASYGVSGIMTFIVSRNGVVFEKDLGEDTVNQAAAMTEFNPDNTWEPVED